MIKNLIATLGFAALFTAYPSMAAAPKKGAANASAPACVKLATKYENFSKQLSMNKVDGGGDNAAVMTEAGLTLDLMRSNGCALPTDTPSDMRYIIKAYECSNTRKQALLAAMEGKPPVDVAPACNWSTWTPDI
ncbi:hypothetical protein [Sphingobium yanoikuyae]|uniref:hypothetical protein n=1 Tax=Sphingobium yanoikuyae TaxID=13690 RepID=UPI0005665625|nr:hypothetical protein [Sphingobium yanoikuyae]MDV3480855.1 hypothetical protein [Sphingobium yanoikuyae]